MYKKFLLFLCVFLFPTVVTAHIALSAITVNIKASSKVDETVTITNIGCDTVYLDEYFIADKNFFNKNPKQSSQLEGTLAAGESIEISTSGFFDLNKANESVHLLDADENEIDSFSYEDPPSSLSGNLWNISREITMETCDADETSNETSTGEIETENENGTESTENESENEDEGKGEGEENSGGRGNSGSNGNSESENSGGGNSGSGSEENDENEETTIHAIFPEILPTIQNYTNATLEENTFVCTKSPCKINLNFDIFDSTYKSSNYTCRIESDHTDIAASTNCNPPQWEFTHSATIVATITDKTSKESKKAEFLVQIPDSLDSTDNTPSTTPKTTKPRSIAAIEISKPAIVILHEGKWEKQYTRRKDGILSCHKEPCSINLSASKTLDISDKSPSFTWFINQKSVSTSRNPKAFTLSSGLHHIHLEVKNKHNEVSRWSTWIQVPSETEKKSGEISDADTDTDADTETNNTDTTTKNIDPKTPKIILQQSPGFALTEENIYECTIQKKRTCTINFLLENTQKGASYHWKYDHQDEPYIGENPRKQAFDAGTYHVQISGFLKENDIPFWEQSLEIIVHPMQETLKTTASKKTSVKKRTTKKSSKKSKSSPSEKENTEDTDDTEEQEILSSSDMDSPLAPPSTTAGLSLLSLFIGGSVLFRKNPF